MIIKTHYYFLLLFLASANCRLTRKNPRKETSKITNDPLPTNETPQKTTTKYDLDIPDKILQISPRSSDLEPVPQEQDLQSTNGDFSLNKIFDMSDGLFGVFRRIRHAFEEFSGIGKEADQQWRQVLGALENFDDVLRSTIPQVDRFQCMERVMCEMSSPVGGQPQTPGFGSILNSLFGSDEGGNELQTLQQQLLQDPLIQQQLAQFEQSQFGQLQPQFGQSQFGQPQPQFGQSQFGQPQPQFGQSQLGQIQFGQPQVLQTQLNFGQPSLQQQAFVQPTFGQSQFQTSPFFREESNSLRRNENGDTREDTQQGDSTNQQHHPQSTHTRQHDLQSTDTRQYYAQPNNYQQYHHQPTNTQRVFSQPQKRVYYRRRPQKNWFQRFFGLKRKKRDLTGNSPSKRSKRSFFESFMNGWTGTRLFGMLDQMAERYSFYPYTHAAYMGMTRGGDSCNTLYPECPSSPEEMINVINNLHRHYPNGFPFKDKIPWPFNMFLP